VLSAEVRSKLNTAGGAGAQGPEGPQGPQGPQGPSQAFSRDLVSQQLNSGPNTVATLSVPAGAYMASAAVSGLTATQQNLNSVSCSLSTSTGATGQAAIQTVPVVTFATYALAPALSFTAASPATLTLSCDLTGIGLASPSGSITAVRVGDLATEPPVT
jgi:hypothetical protein